MKNEISKELNRIEEDYDVKILFACESGSRAWGFPSKDSDYDVRFVYCHQKDWYLNLEKQRDVIEKPIHDLLDISGWDLDKTLRLLRKSNPNILEWATSPIIYFKILFLINLKNFWRQVLTPAPRFSITLIWLKIINVNGLVGLR